jgi:hypothetical protein
MPAADHSRRPVPAAAAVRTRQGLPGVARSPGCRAGRGRHGRAWLPGPLGDPVPVAGAGLGRGLPGGTPPRKEWLARAWGRRSAGSVCS